MIRSTCFGVLLLGLLFGGKAFVPLRSDHSSSPSRNTVLFSSVAAGPSSTDVGTALRDFRLTSHQAVGRRAKNQNSLAFESDSRESSLFSIPLTALFSSWAKVSKSRKGATSSLARKLDASAVGVADDPRRQNIDLSLPKPSSSRTLAQSTETVVLEDVTIAAGINQPSPSLKFGGPFVGDLDGDGLYDLVLSFHNGIRTRLYFGAADGSFTLAPFVPIHRDIHGVTASQRTAHSRDRILAISVGGGNGNNTKPTEIYLVSPDRVLTDISKGLGFGQLASRGRNTVFMNLAMLEKFQKRMNKGGPDVIVTNFLGPADQKLRQFAYENFNGEYKLRDLAGYENQTRGRVEVTDIDNDGIMEVVAIRTLQFYRLVAPFVFADVTEELLPPDFKVPPLSVSAVVEIDFDNDGDFDLFVARADRTLMTNRPELEDDDLSDYLLENRNGRYVDVSEAAGIPKGTNSMGASSGDLNNDGFVDIVVIRYSEPDIVLLNQGDGTFKRVDGLIPKASNTVGNHAVAVDYNLDGRVDVIVGHGDVDTINGTYLIMKNNLSLGENSHFLLVTVANEPSRGATAMHAVVTVFVGGQRITRRIGSPGAQGGGGSYLTTVHFGVGSFSSVDAVRVRWTNGIYRKIMDVPADQKLFFGVL